MSKTHNNNHPTLVVGVGASAGGLDALKRFFRTIPNDSKLAFIVVQHLDPTHESMMAEILSRETSMKVVEAKDKQTIEANSAYIIPPNAYIEVIGHTIKLSKPKQQRGSRMEIDYLLRSMAHVYESRAVGILFSGAGSDGTSGLRALKAAGGLTLAQDPQTADHKSMPRSAIDAGVVDKVLKIEHIAKLLVEYANHPYAEYKEDTAIEAAEKDLRIISALLKARENFDITQYKEGTVFRRICRRMSLTGNAQKTDYIELLRDDESERHSLMQDLLINVTDFFRDPDAYSVLEEKALRHIIDEAETGSDIRIWVAGCATGEEAYSLAMLMTEKIEASGKDLRLKVFGTDIDEEAIKVARRGVYVASIAAQLPDDYLEKYFSSLDENHYKVSSALRGKISFAIQNVYSDPPFSKMDLISCRNLLIYLRRSVQEGVLKSFYFALNPAGYLFLGSSESLGEHKGMFKQISQKWRLFRKETRSTEVSNMAPATPSFFRRSGYKFATVVNNSRKSKPMGPVEQAKEALLKCVAPSVLINGENQIVYLHGDLNDFIKIPEGEPRLDFIQMLDPKLRTRLRSGIFKARRSADKVIIHSPASFAEEYTSKDVFQISISKAGSENLPEDSLIVTFERISINDEKESAKSSLVGLSGSRQDG